MGTDEMRDRVVRLLVEEGVKDAERDIAWYGERIRADIRDGISHVEWALLRDEARAVARAFRGVLAAADKAMPDPVTLAKEAADIAEQPAVDYGLMGTEYVPIAESELRVLDGNR